MPNRPHNKVPLIPLTPEETVSPRTGPPPAIANPEIRNTFINAIAAGASITAALRTINMSWTAWQHWREQAEIGREPYKDFIDEVGRAEAALETRLTTSWLNIINLSEIAGDHRPLMEFLSRRFRQDWSPSFKQEIEAKIGYTNLDAEDVRRRLLSDASDELESSEDS